MAIVEAAGNGGEVMFAREVEALASGEAEVSVVLILLAMDNDEQRKVLVYQKTSLGQG